MGMIFSLILGFVLGAAALLFALQNTEVVALTFMGWQFESSLALLVLASLAAGMLISILASLPSAVSGKFREMRLRNENRKLAEEVDMHRQAANAPEVVVQGDPLV
jgi:lipopolysaccharide assembly protein A